MSVVDPPEFVKAGSCNGTDLQCMWFRLRRGSQGCPHTVNVKFLKQYVTNQCTPHKAVINPRVSESSTLFAFSTAAL